MRHAWHTSALHDAFIYSYPESKIQLYKFNRLLVLSKSIKFRCSSIKMANRVNTKVLHASEVPITSGVAKDGDTRGGILRCHPS